MDLDVEFGSRLDELVFGLFGFFCLQVRPGFVSACTLGPGLTLSLRQ